MGLFRPDYRVPLHRRKVTWLHRLVSWVNGIVKLVALILAFIVVAALPFLILYAIVKTVRLAWGS